MRSMVEGAASSVRYGLAPTTVFGVPLPHCMGEDWAHSVTFRATTFPVAPSPSSRLLPKGQPLSSPQ